MSLALGSAMTNEIILSAQARSQARTAKQQMNGEFFTNNVTVASIQELSAVNGVKAISRLLAIASLLFIFTTIIPQKVLLP